MNAIQRIAASDGVELHVEVNGSGTPWLFSCGYCTTRENWRPQVGPLVAEGAKVILWDYRGHGLSGAPEDKAAYSMRQVVDDMGKVLDAVAPDEPAILAGLSFGGLASLHFALRWPKRVRGLVLAATGPGFKKAEALERWQSQVERTAQVLESRGCEALVRGKAVRTSIGRDPERPAARVAAEAIASQDPAGVAAFGRYVAGPAESVIDDLASIEIPALVVVGEDDSDYQRAADVMAARLPRAERVSIPGAGHVVNIEAEAAFNEAVKTFQASLERA